MSNNKGGNNRNTFVCHIPLSIVTTTHCVFTSENNLLAGRLFPLDSSFHYENLILCLSYVLYCAYLTYCMLKQAVHQRSLLSISEYHHQILKNAALYLTPLVVSVNAILMPSLFVEYVLLIGFLIVNIPTCSTRLTMDLRVW